jgi:hypothetical protein
MAILSQEYGVSILWDEIIWTFMLF